MEDKIRIDGILWYIFTDVKGIRHAQPLCPTHDLRLRPLGSGYNYQEISHHLFCEDCGKSHTIPRAYKKEQLYVIDKIDAKSFKKMRTINFDDEAVPLAENKSKNDKYFVTALLTDSKVGQRLVVYAGENGKPEKTQIFVEPEIKRVSFDHKDLNPSDVFLSFEAVFKDGTKNKTSKK